MAKASTSKSKKTALPRDGLSREQKVEIYRYMLITRRLEERLVNLYRQNAVVGGLYRSLGQEAETIAATYALEPQDPIAPMIRNMGSVLLRGYQPREIVMQYMARSGGPTGGKDLNVHFGSLPEPGVAPAVSMLGDMIPVMAGVALASRMRGEDRVALTYIGDGGTSTGAFYEGMNLAAVWKLPLIVVVENNGYAYSTPMSGQMAVKQVADKGKGLGIPAVTIDGNDALAVYDAVHDARAHCAGGLGPMLVEVMTYRRKGHAEHDMQKYVPEGEINEWEQNDPMDRYHDVLIQCKAATKADLETLDKDVRAYVDAEVEAAEASPFPDPHIALDSVYANPPHQTDHLAPYREEAGS